MLWGCCSALSQFIQSQVHRFNSVCHANAKKCSSEARQKTLTSPVATPASCTRNRGVMESLHVWHTGHASGAVINHITHDSGTWVMKSHLRGWRRCRTQRPGWCAEAGCVRCYWWRRPWRQRAATPSGRAWLSAPSLWGGEVTVLDWAVGTCP